MTYYENHQKESLFPLDNLEHYNYVPKTFIQRARETLSVYGAEECELHDLFAVILGSKATPEVCGRLAGLGIHRLSTLSIQELQEIPGVTMEAAASIVAAFGLANKLAKGRDTEGIISRPSDVANLLMDEMRHLTQEHFVCIFLNTKNKVIGRKTIYKGSLDSSIVHPREIFKEAIRYSSASVICSHNHPSGSPEPSREDIVITNQLREAGEVLGISLLDHIIIGDGVYRSLKEQGYL